MIALLIQPKNTDPVGVGAGFKPARRYGVRMRRAGLKPAPTGMTKFPSVGGLPEKIPLRRRGWRRGFAKHRFAPPERASEASTPPPSGRGWVWPASAALLTHPVRLRLPPLRWRGIFSANPADGGKLPSENFPPTDPVAVGAGFKPARCCGVGMQRPGLKPARCCGVGMRRAGLKPAPTS